MNNLFPEICLCFDFGVNIISDVDVAEDVDPEVDAEERGLAHGRHPPLLQLRIRGSGQSVLHKSVLSKLLDVGHVSDSGLGIDSDDIATLTLLDEVKNDVLADSKKICFQPVL